MKRPRLRSRGPGGQEVAIPLYKRLRDEAPLGSRMSEILVSGISTWQYTRVVPAMAQAAGISKSGALAPVQAGEPGHAQRS